MYREAGKTYKDGKTRSNALGVNNFVLIFLRVDSYESDRL